MIAIIRIRGKVGVKKKVEDTLDRLRLKRKYACVIVREKKELLGMIKKIKDYVAFGNIDKKILSDLIDKRGKILDKTKKTKIDSKKIADELMKSEKKLQDFNLKPFFRLHPPRKGIKSKLHFPKGVLGDHKEKINELIQRML